MYLRRNISNTALDSQWRWLSTMGLVHVLNVQLAVSQTMLYLNGLSCSEVLRQVADKTALLSQAAGVPDNYVTSTIQQGNGGQSPPLAAGGRRRNLLQVDCPFTLLLVLVWYGYIVCILEAHETSH